MIQKTGQAPESGICIAIDMLGHGVVHKRVVFVADEPSAIGDLRDVAAAIALIWSPSVPDLVVEHDYAAGFAEVVMDFVLPFFPLVSTKNLAWVGANEM